MTEKPMKRGHIKAEETETDHVRAIEPRGRVYDVLTYFPETDFPGPYPVDTWSTDLDEHDFETRRDWVQECWPWLQWHTQSVDPLFLDFDVEHNEAPERSERPYCRWGYRCPHDGVHLTPTHQVVRGWGLAGPAWALGDLVYLAL